MIKDLLKFAGRKIAGSNGLLRDITGTYFRQGKYVAASFASLFSIPLSGLLKYDIIKSEDYYRELHKLLKIDCAEGFGLVRIGRDYDGGYILLNDLPGGIAYSFGICNDVSWDKDMASRGYDVFMYDHTIDGLPEQNARFHWSKLGISDGTTNDERLKTLEELISHNGHEGKRDMILNSSAHSSSRKQRGL